MQVAAWITLIFAAIEFAASHYPAKCPSIAGVSADWAASELPPLGTEANTGKKPRSFGHAVTEVVFGFIALVWLALIPKHPYLLMGPGAFYLQASPFQAAPVWVPVFWSIVALNLIQLGWRCIDLIRGSWRGPRLAQNFTVKIFGLIPLALMLTVRDQVYFNLRNPAVNEAHYGAALASINHAIHLGLTVVCVIVVAQLLWDLGRTGVDAYSKHAAAMK
jgi:hypothetical protein